MIDEEKLASMVAAIHLHKDPSDFITNEEELEMWNRLVVEIGEIVGGGDVPDFSG